MLVDYITHPEYEFWTTFSTWDLFDLVLHTGIPLLLVGIGIKKQRAARNG
jgi:hypothetical protein